MNNSICTLFDNILIDIHKFKSLQNVLFIELDVKMHQNTMNAGYFAFNFMLYSLNVS